MWNNQKSEEKRYYFRRGQVVMLFGGFTITAVIIYFLGLLTGINMVEKMLVNKENSQSRIPVEPIILGADTSRGDRLEQVSASHDKMPESSRSRPSQQDQELEDKQLEPSAQAEKPLARQVKRSKSTFKERALGKAEEKTSVLSAEQEDSRPAESVGPNVKGGMWTVQVNSYPDEASAVVWEYALKKRGYDAYTVKADIRRKTWYRVRVGHLASQNEAEALRKVLVSKEGFRDAFLARQQKGDVIVSSVKGK